MAEPHVIRLRGPWLLEPLTRDGAESELPAGGKVPVPGDWRELLGADFFGCARYTRRFNCPTNLEAGERVWLVLDGVDHQAGVNLNGHALGVARGYQSAVRFDLTELLEPHNVLAIDVSLPAAVYHDSSLRPGREGQPGGLIGEVRLEIGPGARGGRPEAGGDEDDGTRG